MIAIGGELGRHHSGAIRILERLVERQHRYSSLATDLPDPSVELGDRSVGLRVTVVPGQHLGEVDGEAEVAAADDDREQVVARAGDRAALGDVVDPALEDERVRSLGAVEPPRDLVGAFAVDPAVAKPKPWIGLLGPVLELAPLVVAVSERLAALGIRVIAWRARRDRVPECGDEDLFGLCRPWLARLRLRLVGTATGRRDGDGGDGSGEACPQVVIPPN